MYEDIYFKPPRFEDKETQGSIVERPSYSSRANVNWKHLDEYLHELNKENSYLCNQFHRMEHTISKLEKRIEQLENKENKRERV